MSWKLYPTVLVVSSRTPAKYRIFVFALYNNRDVYSFTFWHHAILSQKHDFTEVRYNKCIDFQYTGGTKLTLKSIYDIELNSAEGESGFLEQFKGKTTLLVNTTVGCGNANQMEVMQWLQEKYGGEHFQIVAIPTNDYCGPGITKGQWSQGITCGLDSASYAKDIYNTTFEFSEMVASRPNETVSRDLGVEPGHNGLGHPNRPPHELYETIASHMDAANWRLEEVGLNPRTMFKDRYFSEWLNMGFYNGAEQGGNFEKYLIDRDGFVHKHFQCTILNYDTEKTLKDSLLEADENWDSGAGPGRTKKVFEEEWGVICQEIEELIAGKRSIVNPVSSVNQLALVEN